MSHLLKTVNPQAAADIEQRAHQLSIVQPPLFDTPVLGEGVVFHGRPTDWINGQQKWAALVVRVHENGTLDLIVFRDHSDWIGQMRVPRRKGDDAGWLPIEPRAADETKVADGYDPALRDEFDEFKEQVAKALFGKLERPPEALLELMQEFEDRLRSLEARLPVAIPAPAKPKKG